MKQNMGTMDRAVRFLVALGVGVLYLTGQISGIAATLLGVVALAFLATSFIGSCPAYVPFGLSTKKGT